MQEFYTLRDERAQERIIEAAQLEPLFRSLLRPILIEMGTAPDVIAGADINKLVGLIRNRIAEGTSSLEVARLEFGRLKRQRDEDHETILRFIRQHASGPPLDNVRSLEEKREGLAA